jgi:hypothetical protein
MVLYLASRTWPVLDVPVAFLATRVKAPTMSDVRKLKQVFGYIHANQTRRLRIAPTTLQVAAWADASFATHSDAKSHTGYLIGFDGFSGLIQAKSRKQKLVTRSTAESELVACDDSIIALLSARRKMVELGFPQASSPVYQDNQATIKLAVSGRPLSLATRHIAVRYYFISDLIRDNQVHVVYLPTSLMLADILSKPLQGPQFKILEDYLMDCRRPEGPLPAPLTVSLTVLGHGGVRADVGLLGTNPPASKGSLTFTGLMYVCK